MRGDLDAAVRAFAAARDRVAAAEQAVADARADVPRVRARLYDAIVRADAAGMRQIDIAERVGLRREQIRRILRLRGVGPG